MTGWHSTCQDLVSDYPAGTTLTDSADMNPANTIQPNPPVDEALASAGAERLWLGVAMIVAVIVGGISFGYFGLEPLLAPLLTEPKFSYGLLMAYCGYLFVIMAMGTIFTAKNGQMLGAQWSSIWTPIKTALVASVLLPIHEGLSP